MDKMDKYDVKKAHRKFYMPPMDEFTLVDVPEFRYIAVDGSGDPNTSLAYANALEALYPVAYTLKFASRKVLDRDFVVGPLEGLWWADDPTAFVERRKDMWRWTMLISQPDWITESMVEVAVDSVARKSAAKKKDVPALGAVRLLTRTEGTCVQILHIGAYDDEAPTLDRLHNSYLPEHGLTFNGPHHEIYLSDARRTVPAKLKTILRQPVLTINNLAS